MKALRPYQQELMQKYYESVRKGFRRPLIQSPTGSGKSILMMEILQSSVAREKPILMIAHKEELINQLQTHFIKRFGIEPTVIADRSRYKFNPENPYCVASIQGWMSRLNRGLEIPSTPHIILIDEAHHSSSPSYSTLIKHYQECHIVGLTATPYRIDGRGFKYLDNGIEGFDILLKGPAVLDLIEQGYLSEVKYYKAGRCFKPNKLKIVRGEYSQKEQEKLIRQNFSAEDIVDAWMKIAEGKKTILYPVSVALSKEYCEAFNDYGIASAHIDANTPSGERRRILDNFRDGKINVLCQHSIVIEGVDVPDIECVQFVRATTSLNIWWQAVGRGMRPHPDKKHLIVIDHADNSDRLPLITTPFEFFLEPLSLDPSLDNKTSKCPYCEHYYSKNATDYTKFKSLKDLNDIERAILDQKFRAEILRSNGILEGFFIDLICPKCNQSFTEIKFKNEYSSNKPKEREIKEAKLEEKIIAEVIPRNKEEIFETIKEIASYNCSKVKRLAYLDYKLGIKNLEPEEIKLFVNDCQAKKGWIYYISNGMAMENEHFKQCLKDVQRELQNSQIKIPL